MSGPGVNAGFGAGCIAIGGRSADGRRAWLATAFRSWRFCFFDELSDASDLASSDARIWQRLSHSMSSDVSRDTSLACRCSCSVTRRSLIHAERDTPEEADGDIAIVRKAGELRDRGLSSSVRCGDASTLGARSRPMCILRAGSKIAPAPRAACSGARTAAQRSAQGHSDDKLALISARDATTKITI